MKKDSKQERKSRLVQLSPSMLARVTGGDDFVSDFINAGPSQNNRVIERHELNGNQGSN